MQVVSRHKYRVRGRKNKFFFQVPALLSFYKQENSAENGVRTLLFWILCVGFSPMQNKLHMFLRFDIQLYANLYYDNWTLHLKCDMNNSKLTIFVQYKCWVYFWNFSELQRENFNQPSLALSPPHPADSQRQIHPLINAKHKITRVSFLVFKKT